MDNAERMLRQAMSEVYTTLNIMYAGPVRDEDGADSHPQNAAAVSACPEPPCAADFYVAALVSSWRPRPSHSWDRVYHRFPAFNRGRIRYSFRAHSVSFAVEIAQHKFLEYYVSCADAYTMR